MRKSINKMVGIRVATTIAAVLIYSFSVTASIFSIKDTQNTSIEATTLLDTIEKAEVAHYKWSSGLSNALYEGKEFTGSMDPTACVLGQWLYGDMSTDDKKVLALRDELEPLHKELHESASYVLEMAKTNPDAAQDYYQNTIHLLFISVIRYVRFRKEILILIWSTRRITSWVIWQVFCGIQ